MGAFTLNVFLWKVILKMNKRYSEKYVKAWGIALEDRINEIGKDRKTLGKETRLSSTSIHNYLRSGILPNVIIARDICKALDWTVEEWSQRAEEILKKEEEIRKLYAILD